ncbi:MAG: PKD domain-containing protein, partial [Thaumarchaeota archaeon]|nr:PKD domain-containing protein [Nitrososphaerota archaeon]
MKYKLLFTILLASYYTFAQLPCGTEISSEEVIQLENELSLKKLSGRFLQNVAVEIPIKFHSIRRSDGSGGITNSDRDDIIDQLNDFYAPMAVSFFHVGDVNYIDNSDIYDFDSSAEGRATAGNTIGQTINVFFFNSIRSNGNALCGYTRFPPSADHVFVAYDCVLNGNLTLEHELGHYFTLYHTHGTTNTGTTDELVNQSNCTSAGDRLCDTPADPNLSGKVNNNCIYIGIDRDANGETYNPDPSNIMAYSPNRCRNRFTSQQYERMRVGFEQGRSYLNYRAENFIATFQAETRNSCINTPINFRGNSFGATKWEWQFIGAQPPTSTQQFPTVEYPSGGSFDVILKVTNNVGEEFIVERKNYVIIKDPLQGALSGEFSVDLSNEANALS